MTPARDPSDVDRYGSLSRGGLITRAPAGGWRWEAWNRDASASGVADDRTNALCALVHALDPDEAGLR